VLELGPLVGTGCIAVSVDVNEAHRLLFAECLEDRRRDGMIATHAERPHARGNKAAVEVLDILVALGKIETAEHGNIAEIRDFRLAHRRVLSTWS
jgi:hypothetical protein